MGVILDLVPGDGNEQLPPTYRCAREGVAFHRDILCFPFLFAARPQMAFFLFGGVRLLVAAAPLLTG